MNENVKIVFGLLARTVFVWNERYERCTSKDSRR